MKKHKHYKEIIAFAEGKTIEYYSNFNGKWIVTNSPMWNVNTKFRVKPELEYILFTFKDAEQLIGKTVKSKKTGHIQSIIGINKHHIIVGISCLSFNNLFKEYTFLDGTPCGKLKE